MTYYRTRSTSCPDAYPTLHPTPVLGKPVAAPVFLDVSRCVTSGEGGIRTLGTVACTPVFETGPIGRSGTSPGSPAHEPHQKSRGGRPAQQGQGACRAGPLASARPARFFPLVGCLRCRYGSRPRGATT